MRRENPFGDIYCECKKDSNAFLLASPRPYPILLDLELTNLCNFQCMMCPTGRRVLSRPQGFMTTKVFEKVLQEAVEGGCLGIRFVRWGEPLLHPSLLSFIERVVGAGLKCHINTNGFYCDEDFIKRIIRIPLHSIKFSMQGLDKTSYEAIRRNGDYLHLLKAIHLLYLERYKRRFPYISIDTTVEDIADKRIESFRRVMSNISDKVSIKKTREIIFPHSPQTNFPECPELFNKLSLDWDGIVTGCCSDWNRLMVVGDIRNQTLKEIWGGEKMNYYRKVIIEKGHNILPLCSNCKLF